MATLVLSTVGAVIAGPVGASIGSTLGGYIDRAVLFPPKPREGPRLTELALQTSSYGTQIPQLFGTMRVAGTVIWSTDLIESRATSHAKGQPSVTTYSYSASFAVLLSARPIRDVRRIWAEGKLLRGAAGDLKVQTGFRLHLGSEDQAVDPLIASAQGPSAPAHRGGAYVVFENLQLADYGNRIPSLTFEVVADDDPVTAGAVASAIAPEIDAAVALPLGGFAVSGGSVAGVLTTLIDMTGARLADADGLLSLRDVPGGHAIVGDDGVVARGDGAIGQRARAAVEGVPRTVSISHYDPARDYQAGLQRAARPGPGNRDVRLEAPAALDAGAAKAIASAALLRAEAARETRTLTLGFAGMGLAPGDGVTIVGEDGAWVVRESNAEALVTTLTLDALADGEVHRQADSGAAQRAPDTAIGRTLLAAAELPAFDEAILSAPRLTVFAAGTDAGWRRATLLITLDDGASWQSAGSTAAAAVIGTVTQPPADGPSTLIDEAATLVVTLAGNGDTLIDADDRRLDGGANLALVGDELLQFGRAEPLGWGRWRLSRLLRGRRGTEWAIGRQAIGDRFVLIDRDALATLPLPVSAIGSTVRVMASGAGDIDHPAEQLVMVTGASVAPPSPVALMIARQANGDASLRWMRRSRAGWRWTDGVEVPLAEEAERYRVTLIGAGGGQRIVETAEPTLTIAAPDLAGMTSIAVSQLGTVAASLPATITI